MLLLVAMYQQRCHLQPLLATAAALRLLRLLCHRMQAALFGISVAVGLTPEMLPMVVNANLARGAGEGGEQSHAALPHTDSWQVQMLSPLCTYCALQWPWHSSGRL